jgi:NAD-dependent SIR2 family protein deacetylase
VNVDQYKRYEAFETQVKTVILRASEQERMTAVLCSDCGWTGEESELIELEGEDTPQCPVCSEDVQFVD